MLKRVEIPERERPFVTAVIVSRDRPEELAKTLAAVTGQITGSCLSVLVVDSSRITTRLDFTRFEDVRVIHSTANLGGAGGFALGMLSAIAAGAEWLWLMDDDGRPLDRDALDGLLSEAEKNDLGAVSPIILDTKDLSRFAFPYRVNRRYVFRRDELPVGALVHSTAHLFNGLLIRSEVVFKIGLPDLRLFIRGDEIDMVYRLRRANIRFGTTSAVTFAHPSSNDELFPIWGGRLHVVYPSAGWKRRNQYRNRGYNFSRNGEFAIIAVDLLRYPYFFLFRRRFDLPGLWEWARCMWAGMRGRIQVDPTIEVVHRVTASAGGASIPMTE